MHPLSKLSSFLGKITVKLAIPGAWSISNFLSGFLKKFLIKNLR